MTTLSKKKIAYIKSFQAADGTIAPDVLVADARRKTSLLHDEFEWDVQRAAEKHWLDQAQNLIRLVRLEITIRNETVFAPYYARDPASTPKSRRYLALTVAATRRATAQKMLTAELDRIVAAIKRAEQVAAVLGLSDQLEDLLLDVSALQTQTVAATKKKKPGRPKGRRHRDDDGARPQA